MNNVVKKEACLKDSRLVFTSESDLTPEQEEALGGLCQMLNMAETGGLSRVLEGDATQGDVLNNLVGLLELPPLAAEKVREDLLHLIRWQVGARGANGKSKAF